MLMDESFKIYADRLKDGHRETIVEQLPPDFLDVQETGLAFPAPIKIEGEAYLADSSLIIHLEITTEAIMPCAICNQATLVKIHISNFYHAQETSEIKGGVFDLKETLRETILLELPTVVECQNGNCPERKEMMKYCSKNEKQQSQDDHHPFANL